MLSGKAEEKWAVGGGKVGSGWRKSGQWCGGKVGSGVEEKWAVGGGKVDSGVEEK